MRKPELDKKTVDRFKMLYELLDSLNIEMKELSKKKPDEILNTLKVKMVNKVLTQLKELLSNEPTTDFLELLDSDSLPSNSDTVLIISQYIASMEVFSKKHDRFRNII